LRNGKGGGEAKVKNKPKRNFKKMILINKKMNFFFKKKKKSCGHTKKVWRM
jgi:hypothetical protein